MEVDESIKDRLAKNHWCYVLLTCDAPKENGQMNVQMVSEGPRDLASLMVYNAQSYIDDEDLDEIL